MSGSLCFYLFKHDFEIGILSLYNLSMTNDYSERLIFKILGTGCCVPRIERSSPAYFVKFKNKSFLMDCGSGALRQLLRAKEDYKALDGVIFSHFHPDHTSDFIPLIQALDYTPNFRREKDLLLIGPKGLEGFIKGLFAAYKLEPKYFKIKYIELEQKLNITEELTIESLKGNHSPTSILIKITYKDNQQVRHGFVYSGDTDYSEDIADFARNTDVLLLECSFPYKVEGHLTPEEAGRIANEANPKKLVLTHFYPPSDNPDVKIQHRVKEYFIGQVLLAQDFTELVI